MASAMAYSAPRVASATIGAVMAGAVMAGAVMAGAVMARTVMARTVKAGSVMPCDVTGVALIVANGAPTGAIRASVALAGGDRTNHGEKPG
jgi:hypothetical protein